MTDFKFEHGDLVRFVDKRKGIILERKIRERGPDPFLYLVYFPYGESGNYDSVLPSDLVAAGKQNALSDPEWINEKFLSPCG